MLTAKWYYVVSKYTVSISLFQNSGYSSIDGSARKSPVCKKHFPVLNLNKNMIAPGQLKITCNNCQ